MSRNMLQLCAQLAARMEFLEVMGAEALVLKQGDGQGIAERMLQERRGCRRQAIGAGFLGLRQRQHDVGFLTQRARRD